MSKHRMGRLGKVASTTVMAIAAAGGGAGGVIGGAVTGTAGGIATGSAVGASAALLGTGVAGTLGVEAVVDHFMSHPPATNPFEQTSYEIAFGKSSPALQQKIFDNMILINNYTTKLGQKPLSKFRTLQAAVNMLPNKEQQEFNQQVQNALTGLTKAQQSNSTVQQSSMAATGVTVSPSSALNAAVGDPAISRSSAIRIG